VRIKDPGEKSTCVLTAKIIRPISSEIIPSTRLFTQLDVLRKGTILLIGNGRVRDT